MLRWRLMDARWNNTVRLLRNLSVVVISFEKTRFDFLSSIKLRGVGPTFAVSKSAWPPHDSLDEEGRERFSGWFLRCICHDASITEAEYMIGSRPGWFSQCILSITTIIADTGRDTHKEGNSHAVGTAFLVHFL